MNTGPSKPKGRPVADGAAASREAEFPTARYFQIHFEHLEGLLLDTRQRLDALQRQLAEAALAARQEGSGEG